MGEKLENLRKRNDQMLNNDNNKDHDRHDDSIYDGKTALHSIYPQMTRKCCLLNENNNVLVF